MYLKYLAVEGFKSFPEWNGLELMPGVNVLVGLNGTGKSNLTDAVSWALGEEDRVGASRRGGRTLVFAGSEELTPHRVGSRDRGPRRTAAGTPPRRSPGPAGATQARPAGEAHRRLSSRGADDHPRARPGTATTAFSSTTARRRATTCGPRWRPRASLPPGRHHPPGRTRAAARARPRRTRAGSSSGWRASPNSPIG